MGNAVAVKGCVKCAACCKALNFAVQLGEDGKELWAAHYGHAVENVSVTVKHRCKHLNADDRCDIYAKRPRFCRRHQCTKPGTLNVSVEM